MYTVSMITGFISIKFVFYVDVGPLREINKGRTSLWFCVASWALKWNLNEKSWIEVHQILEKQIFLL